MNQDDLKGPICIDRDRMDRALTSPVFTLPNGLTGEQIVAVLNIIAQVSKLVAATEREACAKVCDDIEKGGGHGALVANYCANGIRARKDSA